MNFYELVLTRQVRVRSCERSATTGCHGRGSTTTSSQRPKMKTSRAMMTVSAYVAAVTLAILGAGARASDRTVFGLMLGARFEVPECVKTPLGKGFSYEVVAKATCFQRRADKIAETADIVDDTVTLVMPIAEVPSIVSGTQMMAWIVGGKLEGVGFNTRGYAAQAQALTTLREKYGAPDSMTPKTLRNGLGATFEAFDAVWATGLGDITVKFDSVTSGLNVGLVTIDTTTGLDYRTRRMKDLMQKIDARTRKL